LKGPWAANAEGPGLRRKTSLKKLGGKIVPPWGRAHRKDQTRAVASSFGGPDEIRKGGVERNKR